MIVYLPSRRPLLLKCMGTLTEEKTLLFSFLPFFSMGVNSERKKNSLPGENSLTLFFGRVSSSGKGNRKSLKFFPLKKMALCTHTP